MGRSNRKSKEPLVVYERPEGSAPLEPIRIGGGRPTTLTPEIQERIISLILNGNYARTAALCVGVTETTFYRWLQRGELEGSGLYWEFGEALKAAEAQAEAEAVGEVRMASRNKEQWAAGMTWLERKFPTRWGRQDRSEHTGEIRIKVVRDNESD
jgi:transposase